MNLSHLIASYGYRAVFALVTAESMGIPVPSETALIIAAAWPAGPGWRPSLGSPPPAARPAR